MFFVEIVGSTERFPISVQEGEIKGGQREMADHVEDRVHQPESQEKIHSNMDFSDDAVFNDNPIEQVRLTVPITDDPSEQALTFRTWVLG
ncbi:putative Oligopeptide transporter [Quillaja saponaria]|uniref:Oligopeptide transporter n=1 Tax=Quillaja saponaria TaxID=32244 RepID=A0AAD7PM23_QUISA|nr:putative Oligopeptide transporter [Quillaja saponaria]